MLGPGWNGQSGSGPNGYQGPGMGMMGGMMRILINPATVPPGQVSFRVTNAGAINHELVVLPLQKKANTSGSVPSVPTARSMRPAAWRSLTHLRR